MSSRIIKFLIPSQTKFNRFVRHIRRLRVENQSFDLPNSGKTRSNDFDHDIYDKPKHKSYMPSVDKKVEYDRPNKKFKDDFDYFPKQDNYNNPRRRDNPKNNNFYEPTPYRQNKHKSWSRANQDDGEYDRPNYDMKYERPQQNFNNRFRQQGNQYENFDRNDRRRNDNYYGHNQRGEDRDYSDYRGKENYAYREKTNRFNNSRPQEDFYKKNNDDRDWRKPKSYEMRNSNRDRNYDSNPKSYRSQKWEEEDRNEPVKKFKKAKQMRDISPIGSEFESPRYNNVDDKIITNSLRSNRPKPKADKISEGEHEFFIKIKDSEEKSIEEKNIENLELSQPLLQFLVNLNIKSLSPVQTRCLSLLKSRKDIFICAQTGSGKTLAYLLPLLIKFGLKPSNINVEDIPKDIPLTPDTKNMEIDKEQGYFDEIPEGLIGLSTVIIVPNIILVRQLMSLLHALHQTTNLKSCNLMSLSDILDKPSAKLFVTTPKRLFDLFINKKITNDRNITFVIDEADMILEDNPDIVKFLVENFSQIRKPQMVLVSSTLPPISILQDIRQYFKSLILAKVDNHKLVSQVEFQFKKILQENKVGTEF